MSSKEDLNRAFQQLEQRLQMLAIERNGYMATTQILTNQLASQAKCHAAESLRLQATIDKLHAGREAVKKEADSPAARSMARLSPNGRPCEAIYYNVPCPLESNGSNGLWFLAVAFVLVAVGIAIGLCLSWLIWG